MDRANANLVQAPKQVLGKVHGILKLPRSDVGRRHVELLMADEEGEELGRRERWEVKVMDDQLTVWWGEHLVLFTSG